MLRRSVREGIPNRIGKVFHFGGRACKPGIGHFAPANGRPERAAQNTRKRPTVRKALTVATAADECD